MTDQLRNEHRAIAAFAASRVFPSLDEFTSAHKLSVSVESGILVLLAQRLAYQGFKPSDVVGVVEAALASMEPTKQQKRTAAEPTFGENVVIFQRRK